MSDLQDAHDQYYLLSDFQALLGFSVDLYDGHLLIDSVDRSLLPVSQFPFEIGDELIRVDDQPAADLVKSFSKYVSGGNPRTVSRLAAELVTSRYQFQYPYAAQIGDAAVLTILRRGCAQETYSVPWQKSGTVLTCLGASPGPSLNSLISHKMAARTGETLVVQNGSGFYQQVLHQLQTYNLHL